MATGATTDLYERLAEAVRNYSVLYDKASPDFKDNNKKSLTRELKARFGFSSISMCLFVFLYSCMLESNLALKGSPAARLRQIFMLLRLCMSPYAYAYRTCKHPCAYAYACVVRVNQA